MKLFRWWFSRKTTEIPVGSLWVIKPDDGDPFGPRSMTPSKVLAVKDGWVKYVLGPDEARYPEMRRTVEMFLELYEPYKAEEEEYSCGYNTVLGAFHKPGCAGECGYMNPGEAVLRRRIERRKAKRL